jgi:hypothetical protein
MRTDLVEKYSLNIIVVMTGAMNTPLNRLVLVYRSLLVLYSYYRRAEREYR